MSATEVDATIVSMLDQCDARLAVGDWSAAADAARAALADSPDLPEGLERLARAVRWLDEVDESFSALERAFTEYRRRGDDQSAGRIASALAFDNVIARRELAVANGWFARAHELLDPVDTTGEWGWLRFREAQVARYVDHDLGNTLALAGEAKAVADSSGDIVLGAAASALIGLVEVCLGEVEQGMAKLDRAGTAVVSGEVDTIEVAGVICCDVIFACEHVRDPERARGWLRAAARIANENDLTPLIGSCQMHYATLLMWEGDWPAAEQALERAGRAFGIGSEAYLGENAMRLAQLRTLQGRFDDAWAICESMSWTAAAKLGQAQIAFARDQQELAAELLDGFFAGSETEGVGRERVAEALALRVRLALEAGDIELARGAAGELAEIADQTQTSALGATAALAAGRLAIAEGDGARARIQIEEAIGLWMGTRAPYEAACARLVLAEALEGDGEVERATAERARAEELFANLGGGSSSDDLGVSPLSNREREVLRLVAEGLGDEEVAERLVISPHTVHRHVANIRTKLDEPTRAAAVAHAARLGLI